MTTVQPHDCWQASALPNGSSELMVTPANSALSAADGEPVKRQRLPPRPFLPRSAFKVAFSEKHFGQPDGGETRPFEEEFFAGSDETTSDGSGQ